VERPEVLYCSHTILFFDPRIWVDPFTRLFLRAHEEGRIARPYCIQWL
jgi:hypothetical protein